jgi:hypothetical protein
MALRTPEELDAMEEARQKNLGKAKSNLATVALVVIALVMFLVYAAGYSAGMADVRQREHVSDLVTSRH